MKIETLIIYVYLELVLHGCRFVTDAAVFLKDFFSTDYHYVSAITIKK